MASKKATRDTVVKAINEAYDSVDDQSGLALRVANAAMGAYKGDAIAQDERDSILAAVVEAHDWSDATAKVRRSEIGKILAAYMHLPDAIPKAREVNGGCFNWRDGVALSRQLIKAKGDVDEAVSAFAAAKNAKRSAPKTIDNAADARTEAAKLLKRLVEVPKLPRKLRDALVELATEHKIPLA